MLSSEMLENVKTKIIDSIPPEEQRNLLIEFAAYYHATIDQLSDELSAFSSLISFVDQAYSNGLLLPQAYCYLAFISKILSISLNGSRDWSHGNRIIGYLHWNMMGIEERKSFQAAIDSDITRLLNEKRKLPAEVLNMKGSQVSLPKSPLKNTISSMIRALIYDKDHTGLRELILWCYTCHENFLSNLLCQSNTIDEWLANTVELIPRLLLKNIVSIYDLAKVCNPTVGVFEFYTETSPKGFHDSGFIGRPTSLMRSLFLENELDLLAQSNQRISELFAHTYPILLIDDPKVFLEDFSTNFLRFAQQQGRINARKFLETKYRYELKIPTFLYEKLNETINHM